MIEIGHAVADLSGQFLDADDVYCALTGYSSSRLASKDIMAITFDEDRERNARLLHGLIAFHRPFFIYKRYKRSDGKLIYVSNYVSKLTGVGNSQKIVATCHFLPAGFGLTAAQSALDRGADFQSQTRILKEMLSRKA